MIVTSAVIGVLAISSVLLWVQLNDTKHSVNILKTKLENVGPNLNSRLDSLESDLSDVESSVSDSESTSTDAQDSVDSLIDCVNDYMKTVGDAGGGRYTYYFC